MSFYKFLQNFLKIKSLHFAYAFCVTLLMIGLILFLLKNLIYFTQFSEYSPQNIGKDIAYLINKKWNMPFFQGSFNIEDTFKETFTNINNLMSSQNSNTTSNIPTNNDNTRLENIQIGRQSESVQTETTSDQEQNSQSRQSSSQERSPESRQSSSPERSSGSGSFANYDSDVADSSSAGFDSDNEQRREGSPNPVPNTNTGPNTFNNNNNQNLVGPVQDPVSSSGTSSTNSSQLSLSAQERADRILNSSRSPSPPGNPRLPIDPDLGRNFDREMEGESNAMNINELTNEQQNALLAITVPGPTNPQFVVPKFVEHPITGNIVKLETVYRQEVTGELTRIYDPDTRELPTPRRR